MTLKNKLLEENITYIIEHQNENGSFPHESSATNFLTHTKRTSVFFTALTSQLLSKFSTDKKVKKSLNKSTRWIIQQASPDWTFNYWGRKNSEFSMFPLPDDIDDTSCALSSIYGNDTQKISEKILKSFTQILCNQEKRPGGPYKTWITDNSDPLWSNIDVGVNANIGYFLWQNGIILKPLNNYIKSHIVNNDLKSDFYISPLFIIFLLSRWFQLKNNQEIVSLTEDYLLRANEHEKLLGLLTLSNYNSARVHLIKEATEIIKNSQHIEKIHPLSIDISIQNKIHFAGSSVFIAALATNVIDRYL